MKSSAICFLLLLACQATSGFADRQGVLKTPGGDPASGVGVYSVLMSCSGWSGCEASLQAGVVTGADGAYALPDQPPPSDQVRYVVAYAPGKYLGWSRSSVQNATSEQRGEEAIVLHRVAPQTGKVTNKQGKPVAGAKVTCYCIVLGERDESPMPYVVLKQLGMPVETASDPNGRYTLADIPEGYTPVVLVSKEGMAMQGECIESPSLDVVLEPGGRVTGQVLDDTGKPLAGATVRVGGTASISPSSTDSSGAFVVEGVPPGDQEVRVYADDFAFSDIEPVRVEAGKSAKVPPIRAVTLSSLSGRVVYEDTGAGAPGIKVRAIHWSESVPMLLGMRPSVTSDDGSFTVKCGRGEVSLVVVDPPAGYLTLADSSLDVPEGGLKDIVLELTKGQVVTGTVVDEAGKPVAGARVDATGADGSQPTTGEDGTFSLTLPPKQMLAMYPDIVVDVKAEDQGLYATASFSSAQSLQPELKLVATRALSLPVSVKLPSGKPAANAELFVSELGTGMTGISSHFSVDLERTDAKGSAVVSGIRPGTKFRVQAFLPGYFDAGDRPGTVAGPGMAAKQEIVLVPAVRTQKGKVIDKEGNPVAGAKVRVSVGLGLILAETVTDPSGLFVLKGLPDQPVQAQARKGSASGSLYVSRRLADALIQIQSFDLAEDPDM